MGEDYLKLLDEFGDLNWLSAKKELIEHEYNRLDEIYKKLCEKLSSPTPKD